MRTKPLPKLAAVSAAFALNFNVDTAALDAWVTVDAHQPLDQVALDSFNGTEIAISPLTGRIFTSGGGGRDREGNWVATVRGTFAADNDWDTLESYTDPDWPWTHFRGVAADAFGRILAAGEVYNSVGPQRAWIVRESTDGGQSWTTADFFRQSAQSRQSCGDIKVNPSGDVYAAGYVSDAAGFSWVMRKRAMGADQFITVDSVPSGDAYAIAFHPTGVFAVGYTATPYSVWTVRKSPTGAPGTWTTVDSFVEAKGYNSAAIGIGVDSRSGAIYVSGRAKQVVGKGRNTQIVDNWIVRKSTNGGSTWTVVDRFGGVTDDSLVRATSVAVDSADGTVFVSGSVRDQWVVRKGTPSGGSLSWVISDQFALASNRASNANGITIDQTTGDVYATGGANDTSDAYGIGMGHWITRKLAR